MHISLSHESLLFTIFTLTIPPVETVDSPTSHLFQTFSRRDLRASNQYHCSSDIIAEFHVSKRIWLLHQAHQHSTYSSRKLVPCALITQAVRIIDFANHYISQGIVFQTTDVAKEGNKQRMDATRPRRIIMVQLQDPYVNPKQKIKLNAPNLVAVCDVWCRDEQWSSTWFQTTDNAAVMSFVAVFI